MDMWKMWKMWKTWKMWKMLGEVSGGYFVLRVARYLDDSAVIAEIRQIMARPVPPASTAALLVLQREYRDRVDYLTRTLDAERQETERLRTELANFLVHVMTNHLVMHLLKAWPKTLPKAVVVRTSKMHRKSTFKKRHSATKHLMFPDDLPVDYGPGLTTTRTARQAISWTTFVE